MPVMKRIQDLTPEDQKTHFTYGVYLHDVKSFVSSYLKDNNIKVTLSGGLNDPDKRPRNLIESAMQRMATSGYLIYSSIAKYENLPKVLLPSKQAIGDALDEVIFEERKSKVKELSDRLACTGEDLTELAKWVKAINPNYTKADLMKAAHFIWQVKRKLAGKPTKWETLLHLYSREQGLGKSWAIREYLLKPLEPAVIFTKLSTFCDERSTAALEKNFVAFVDEIDWADNASVEYLKNIITSSEVGYRPMRTNEVVQVKNNVTLITAANRHIYEIITDNSGNRRYHEIEVPTKSNWELLKSIDYLALYRGIDENDVEGYSVRVQDELGRELEAYKTPSDIEVYITDRFLKPESGSKQVSLDDLFDDYRAYCSASGIANPLNKNWFSRNIHRRGVVTKRLTLGKVKVQVAVVDVECPVREYGSVSRDKGIV